MVWLWNPSTGGTRRWDVEVLKTMANARRNVSKPQESLEEIEHTKKILVLFARAGLRGRRIVEARTNASTDWCDVSGDL